jgi:hypothetical protein
MKTKRYLPKGSLTHKLLYNLVKKEVELIKQHFTKEQINILINEWETINPNHPSECIYGKMVGNCNSPIVTDFIDNNLTVLLSHSPHLKKTVIDLSSTRSAQYYTPLEHYIESWDEEDVHEDSFGIETSDESRQRIEHVISLFNDK